MIKCNIYETMFLNCHGDFLYLYYVSNITVKGVTIRIDSETGSFLNWRFSDDTEDCTDIIVINFCGENEC